MKNLIIMLLFTGCCFIVSAQNNAIFKGGDADGWHILAYQQASNNIFNGGNNGGWNKTSFSQAGNNIFFGGDGDGWDKRSFSQSVNNIFNGGDGDGWDKTAFSQSVNNIFNGGDGDGWDKTNYLQAGNNIFSGGEGDGWSSTYRPMGPLPVTLLYFTAFKNSSSSSLLQWKTSQEINSAKFEVERSNDAITFSKIGAVNAAGNSTVSLEYSFTDNDPVKGMNYYRLKQIDLNGRLIYTPARLVIFDGADAGSVKYYPNPTKGLVYVEFTSPNNSDVRVINISNVAGVVVNQLRVSSAAGTKITIDLSRYAKGIYFIQLKAGTLNSTQRIVLQ